MKGLHSVNQLHETVMTRNRTRLKMMIMKWKGPPVPIVEINIIKSLYRETRNLKVTSRCGVHMKHWLLSCTEETQCEMLLYFRDKVTFGLG
jgi:hypothetical protein